MVNFSVVGFTMEENSRKRWQNVAAPDLLSKRYKRYHRQDKSRFNVYMRDTIDRTRVDAMYIWEIP